jgi:hypothetical protein
MSIKIPIISEFNPAGVKSAEAQFKSLTTNTQKGMFLLQKAVIPAVGAIAGIAAVIKPAITAASNMEESVSKVNVIFGSGAKSVTNFAKTAATQLGQSAQSVLDAAGTFGTFGKAAGLSGEQLATFSNHFTGLATDLASFNNTTPEDAINAIGAALRGESEPLRRYGVLLDDATLKAEAMRLGIYKGSGTLTAQQKILAAQSAIYKQTGDAQGDFIRTSDGLANSQRTLSAILANLQVQLGQKLLPVMKQFTQDLVGIATFVQSNPAIFNKIGDGFLYIFKMADPATKAIGGFFKVFSGLANLVGGADKKTGAYNQALGRSAQAQIRMADAAGIANRKLTDQSSSLKSAGGAADTMKQKIKDARSEIEKAFVDAIDKANEKLKLAKDAYNAFRDTVAGSITGEFSISAAADAAKEAGTTILDQLNQQAAAAKVFGAKVETLLANGLSESALKKVLDAGQTAGTAIADELIAGGQEAITGPSGINALVADLESVAGLLGTKTADIFYGAGVASGTALVAGVNDAVNKYKEILKDPNLSLADLKGIGAQFGAEIDTLIPPSISGGTTGGGGGGMSSSVEDFMNQRLVGLAQSNTYQITVNGGMLTNAEVGQAIVNNLRAYNRAAGPASISTTSYL